MCDACVTRHPTLPPPSLLSISPSSQQLLLSDVHVTDNPVPEDESPGSGKAPGTGYGASTDRVSTPLVFCVLISPCSLDPQGPSFCSLGTWTQPAMAPHSPDPTLVWHGSPGSAAGLWVGLHLMTLEPTHLASWLTLGGSPSPRWLPAL